MTNFPNGATFKGRFEFTKDARCFWYAMATFNEAYVELVEYKDEREVTFTIWNGENGVSEAIVRSFIKSVCDAARRVERQTAKTASPIVGLEPHVFCESVKLLADYDGGRDSVFWKKY